MFLSTKKYLLITPHITFPFFMATLLWQRNICHPVLSCPIDVPTVIHFCFPGFFGFGVVWVLGVFVFAVCPQTLEVVQYIIKCHLFHRFSLGIRTTNKYMGKMVLSTETCPFRFLIISPKLPRRILRLSGKKYVLISERQLMIHVYLQALFETGDL